MTRELRIIDTGLKPACWNVAMTAALAELHASGRIPDTLRFHRYPTCVLIGRSQDAGHATDLAHCRAANIEIARRVTGGGAVFMTPGTLAWDVVIDRGAFARFEDIARSIGEGVAAGLSQFGVEACFRAPNDIAIDGRKVSGTSGFANGRSCVLQGTVLVTSDFPVMARALRIHEPVLRETVTSLAAMRGEPPSLSRVMSFVTSGLAKALGREVVIGTAGDEEIARCQALLYDEIGTEEFVSGASVGDAA